MDGKNITTGEDTPCKIHKEIIIQAISSEVNRLEDILELADTVNNEYTW